MVEVLYKKRRNYNTNFSFKNEAESLFKDTPKGKVLEDAIVKFNQFKSKSNKPIKEEKVKKEILMEKKKEPPQEVKDFEIYQNALKEKKTDRVELIGKVASKDISKLHVWEASIELLKGAVINGFLIDDLNEVHKQFLYMLQQNADNFNRNYDNARTARVSVEDSIMKDKNHLLCMSCGKEVLNLAVHIRMKHKMSKLDYLVHWNLPPDYPFLHPSDKKRRSEFLTEKWKDPNFRRKIIKNHERL